MPSLKKHCEISLKRTSKDYKELHEWMDEPKEYLGKDHRFERHSGIYIPYVKKMWGVEGIKEFLNHIIEDFKDTLRKYEGVCIKCGNDTWKGNPLCLKCYKLRRKFRKK